MALYTNRDIQSSVTGDLVLDSKGDLDLADALDTYTSAANFVLRTDFGEYAPDSTVGANLGSFIGKMNTSDNHRFMEYNINKTLKEKIFSSTDIDNTVVPFDNNECICFIRIGGSYLIDGVITTVQDRVITYTFPYIDAEYITPLSIE